MSPVRETRAASWQRLALCASEDSRNVKKKKTFATRSPAAELPRRRTVSVSSM
jgi:hypothetical protein